MSENFRVEIKGTRPLLMNSCRYMIEEKEKKPTRSREEMTLREEAERVLYTDKNGKPIVPSDSLFSSIIR